MMQFQRALARDELWDGEMVQVTIGTRKVLLACVGEQIYAYENRCPHLGMPLDRGSLKNGVLRCAFHEWSFDVCTGKGVNPRDCQLKSFPVKVTEDTIFVACEEERLA